MLLKQYRHWLTPLPITSIITFVNGIIGLFHWDLKLGYLFSIISFCLSVFGIGMHLVFKKLMELSYFSIFITEALLVLIISYYLNLF